MQNDKQHILTPTLMTDVRQIIDNARSNAVRSVDFCRVQMYWHLGQRIFEEEQQGKERADYGTYLIRNLAHVLEPEYGSGFGVRQLEMCRQFYRTYPIANTVCSQLNWSQYKLLISISDSDKREYYKLEAVNNCWTKRELERQIHSQLYERLLLCTEKNDTMVRISLPEDNKTIRASKYELYLPSEEQFRTVIEKEKQRFISAESSGKACFHYAEAQKTTLEKEVFLSAKENNEEI